MDEFWSRLSKGSFRTWLSALVGSFAFVVGKVLHQDGYPAFLAWGVVICIIALYVLIMAFVDSFRKQNIESDE